MVSSLLGGRCRLTFTVLSSRRLLLLDIQPRYPYFCYHTLQYINTTTVGAMDATQLLSALPNLLHTLPAPLLLPGLALSLAGGAGTQTSPQ